MRLPALAEGQVCLGVAVALPADLTERVVRARRSFDDPDADIAPPHVTVLPPTAMAAASLDAVRRHLAEAAARIAPFVVRLRSTGCFQPVSPVVFLNVEDGFDACLALEKAIRRGPLAVETRFPFHPHVTVAQGVAEGTLNRAMATLAGFDESFQVTRVDLWQLDARGVRPVAGFELLGKAA
jgi:2'-5' RNA ligase